MTQETYLPTKKYEENNFLGDKGVGWARDGVRKREFFFKKKIRTKEINPVFKGRI
jgi:hypothetical protein